MTFFAARPLGNQHVQQHVVYTPRPGDRAPPTPRPGNRAPLPPGIPKVLQVQRPTSLLDASLSNICNEFSYHELQEATQNFSPAMQLGKGSFGSVFRGVQHDGTEVAVKAIDMAEETEGFDAEVRTLSMFRHPNLVCLIGFARHESYRFLVYELLSDGDVQRRIQTSLEGTRLFLWKQRLNTALDAACGLSHMHNMKPRAFHRDIKTANILLSRDGTAKMADFGFACRSSGTAFRCKHAAGTRGYACPHYVETLLVTERSEVYSFGVVLLELLTGLPPYAEYVFPVGGTIEMYLANKIDSNLEILLSMIDESASWPMSVARDLAALAMRCIHDCEALRPTFKEVVKELRFICNQSQEVIVSQPKLGKVRPTTLAARVEKFFFDAESVSLGGSVVDQPSSQPSSQPNLQSYIKLQPILNNLQNVALTETNLDRSPKHSPPNQLQMWKLECVDVKPTPAHLASLAPFERVLLPDKENNVFHVGRSFQNALFAHLLPHADHKNSISRKHFEIQTYSKNNASSTGFCLFNLSCAGTRVNDKSIFCEGEHADLCHGDLITIPASDNDHGPSVHFRFLICPESDKRHEEQACIRLQPNEYMLASPTPSTPGRLFGEPLIGNSCIPFFVLEPIGCGVKLDSAEHLRRLVHGPAFSGGTVQPICVGRHEQFALWLQLLDDSCTQKMSREHFSIGCSKTDFPQEFYVENLSSTNPIRLVRPEGTAIFQKKQKEILRDNDEIVVVRERSVTKFALRFRITSASLGGKQLQSNIIRV